VLAFVVGYVIATTAKKTKAVLQTTTVYSRTISNVPVGCREAIALTRQVEQSGNPKQIAEDAVRFVGAAAGCQLPAGCRDAITYLPQIVTETNLPKLLALGREFNAAALSCH
jgi:hypothetical protein